MYFSRIKGHVFFSMIYNVMKYLGDELCDYMNSHFNSLEKLVEIGSIRVNTESETPNKIIITLLSMERETGVGRGTSSRSYSSSSVQQSNEPWHFHLYFVMAAVFEEKRYAESIEKLNASIEFLQMTKSFTPNNSSSFTVEPVSYTMHELSNLWGMMGGHHYPAFFGKIRMLTFDGQRINRVASRMTKPKPQVKY